MAGGESKSNIADSIDGSFCADALAGIDALELQRRLCVDVLCGGLLSQTAGVVAAIHHDVRHRCAVELAF